MALRKCFVVFITFLRLSATESEEPINALAYHTQTKSLWLWVDEGSSRDRNPFSKYLLKKSFQHFSSELKTVNRA